jgi:hypothetical protein
VKNLITRTGTVHATAQLGDRVLCGAATTPSRHGAFPYRDDKSVTCRSCLRVIAKLHAAALEVNAAITEGATAAEKQLDEYGENCFNSTMSDSALANSFELQKGWLKADINTALDHMGDKMRRNLVARATLVVLYGAEIAFRRQLDALKAEVEQKIAAGNKARVQRFQENARTFVEGVQDAEPFTVALPPREPSMPTENNYGERTAEQKADERVRLVRAEEATRALLRGITLAGRPEPSEAEMRAALVSLDHTEAIEEDRARFPYESFKRFDIPMPVGHRVGMKVEIVHMIGSDFSRTIYPQNMALIVRTFGIPQVVPEDSLLSLA